MSGMSNTDTSSSRYYRPQSSLCQTSFADIWVDSELLYFSTAVIQIISTGREFAIKHYRLIIPGKNNRLGCCLVASTVFNNYTH